MAKCERCPEVEKIGLISQTLSVSCPFSVYCFSFSNQPQYRKMARDILLWDVNWKNGSVEEEERRTSPGFDINLGHSLILFLFSISLLNNLSSILCAINPLPFPHLVETQSFREKKHLPPALKFHFQNRIPPYPINIIWQYSENAEAQQYKYNGIHISNQPGSRK